MRIAIPGLGIIAPAAPAPIDRFDTAGLASHSAALVRDFKPRDFIAPMKLRRMNQLSRLTVVAVRLALGLARGERTVRQCDDPTKMSAKLGRFGNQLLPRIGGSELAC